MVARWTLTDGAVLTLAVNLGEADVPIQANLFDGADRIFPETAAASTDVLPGDTTWAFVGPLA